METSSTLFYPSPLRSFSLFSPPRAVSYLSFPHLSAQSSDGQTPWPNGRPADTDHISDHWSKLRNIVFFRKKFRKGVHQNIDYKADIWSEPSQGSKFWRKKNISTMNFLDVEM